MKEANFQPVKDVSGNSYIQIEMAGGSKEEVENLLSKQGRFEGKIERVVETTDGSGVVKIEGENYDVTLLNNSIIIDSETILMNQSATVNGITVQYANRTDDTVVLMLTVFTGKDIQSVCMQDSSICTSRVIQSGSGWEFNFQVFITEESAETFAAITDAMEILSEF